MDGSAGFRKLLDTFLKQPGLPFAEILSPKLISRGLRKHGGLVGRRGLDNTVFTLWAFPGRVLRDGKLATRQQAVDDIVSSQTQTGGPVPTAETGDYCKVRASLPVESFRELACETAARTEKSRHLSGCGKAATQSWWTVPRSRCPIPVKTRRCIRSSATSSRAWAFSSTG